MLNLSKRVNLLMRFLLIFFALVTNIVVYAASSTSYTPVTLHHHGCVTNVGQHIPVLEVATLKETKLLLPHQLTKPITIALFAFDRNAEQSVVSWMNHLEYHFESHELVDICKVAMVGPSNYFTKWFVETNIRTHLEKKHLDSTYIYYGDLAPWKKLLKADNINDCHVVVLDKAGTLCAHFAGAVNSAIVQTITALHKRLQPVQ